MGPDGDFALLTRTGANVVHTSDGDLAAGSEFCYKVRAAQTSGSRTTYSAFSNTACALPLPPAAPSNASAVAVSQSRIDLSWQDNSSAETRFRILRSAAGGDMCIGRSTEGPRGSWSA